MPRAFLSHSSDDKNYVEEVATQLTRVRARIDSRSFRPGEDFRDAIRRVMDETDAFVLFVSPQSLASSWVQFEIDEAEIRRLRRTLHRSLAIFIGGPIDPGTLPEWLARIKAVRHTTPGQSARTIESLLLEVAPEAGRPFIGRNDDLQRGVRKLATDDPPPRVLVVSGLQGVGRRSYVRRLVNDALSLDLGPIFTLERTSTLEDLFLDSHLSSSMLTREEAEREIEAFRKLATRDQTREVADQLIFLAQDGAAPCIVDRGAMLDSAGQYFPEYADLIADYLRERDVYLCLLHTRVPDYRRLGVRYAFFERRLRPLAPPDAQALIGRLLREINIEAEPSQTARLAAATNGYPPAAYFLSAQVEEYGIDVILNDESRMNDFNNQSFARFVRDLNLSASERELLVYLAAETRLSLAGIASATGQELTTVSTLVTQLIDLSVIEVTDNEYSVTAPIQGTVLRVEQTLGRNWYERAFKRLEAEYWADEHALPPISVVDATLRARLRVGIRGTEGYGPLVRPSLLINAAEEMYHGRDYKRALDYLERAETMGASSAQLLEIRIKSLAQLGRYGTARGALRRYREYGERRQWYLDGFIDRKAGTHDQACSKFQRGYAKGDRSTSLLRDYADSLFRTDAFDDAAAIAREGLARDPGSVYILDLVARIEIAAGTQTDAEAAVQALEAADLDKQFAVQRRMAYLIYRRGNAESIRRAVALGEEAIGRREAPLEVYVLLANALIRAKSWERLDEIKAELRKRRDIDKREVLGRLDLEAAIQAGEWRRAEQLLPDELATFEDRDLAAAVFELKAADRSVLLAERQQATEEVERLRNGHAERRIRPPVIATQYE